MRYGGVVLVSVTVVVFFFHRPDHFELSSPSPSEISYVVNMLKEPFLVALAGVFHQSGFFSTQPWPYKNSGESEKSFPHLPPYFFRESLVSEKNPSKWMINVPAEKRFYMFTVKYSKWLNSSYSLIELGVFSILSCLISL